MNTKTRPGVYTPEQKVAAVRKLHANKGDIGKTAMELHVPKSTLLGWDKRIGAHVESGSSTMSIIKQTGLRPSQIGGAMLERNAPRASMLMGEAFDKARELVRDETDLGKLNGTLRVLCDLVVRLGQQASDANATMADSVSLYQQAVQEINSRLQAKDGAEDAEEVEDGQPILT